ncbi:Stress responsive alpha-beta barrel domain protein [Euphorbia peplus]|nr:Stress responsive alpha-beta barrel domain protein [Euphorbia peplus]
MVVGAISLSPSSVGYPSLGSDFPLFRRLASNVSHRSRRMTISASNGSNYNLNLHQNRKVVEHICLLEARKDLSDEDENDMLDYLYTCQYQMPGILAISLGRISKDSSENYTHAVFMRFQRREDVAKFYENPFYMKVLKEHVMPYCHGLMNVDFESEVEDDILPIFRKGEEFNYGLEFVHLISFDERAYGIPVEDALGSLKNLTREFPSLIVQSTQGSNFNRSSQEYTHGIVTRFRSLEAFEMFVGSTEYKNMWNTKFAKIVLKTLPIHYSVDPVGKEIM